jgi:hypothetical protein
VEWTNVSPCTEASAAAAVGALDAACAEASDARAELVDARSAAAAAATAASATAGSMRAAFASVLGALDSAVAAAFTPTDKDPSAAPDFAALQPASLAPPMGQTLDHGIRGGRDTSGKRSALAAWGLHSSTFQLNLRRLCHRNSQSTQLIPLKVMKLSRNCGRV